MKWPWHIHRRSNAEMSEQRAALQRARQELKKQLQAMEEALAKKSLEIEKNASH